MPITAKLTLCGQYVQRVFTSSVGRAPINFGDNAVSAAIRSSYHIRYSFIIHMPLAVGA